MSRHYFHIVILTVLSFFPFISCTVDEDFSDLEAPRKEETSPKDKKTASQPNGAEIVFSVQSDIPARGSEEGSIPSSFRITAFDGSVNYFDRMSDLVTSDDNGSTWTSDHRRYWPGSPASSWKGLDFYAYSVVGEGDATRDMNGATEEFDFSKEVPSVRNFKVSPDIRSQKDLMYAMAADVRNAEGSGKVDLHFRHALSKIAFQVSNDNSDYDNVEILSIEIGGVKGSGDYRFPKKKEANESLITFSDKEERGIWTVPSSAADEVYAITGLNVNLAGPGKSGSGSYLSASMLMIPQSVEACSGEDSTSGSYIRVKMKVTLKGSGQAYEDTIFVPISINWKEGKSYLYYVSIDSPFLSVCECESEFK